MSPADPRLMLSISLRAAARRLRWWFRDLRWPPPFPPFPEPHTLERYPGSPIEVELLPFALACGAYLRTRDNHRVRLAGIDRGYGNDSHPIRGEIELVDEFNDFTAWHELTWFSDGAHALYEHPWDLVSVETATCIHCGCDDLHACQTSGGPCSWVTVDRETRTGECSACHARAAA